MQTNLTFSLPSGWSDVTQVWAESSPHSWLYEHSARLTQPCSTCLCFPVRSVGTAESHLPAHWVAKPFMSWCYDGFSQKSHSQCSMTSDLFLNSLPISWSTCKILWVFYVHVWFFLSFLHFLCFSLWTPAPCVYPYLAAAQNTAVKTHLYSKWWVF